MPLVTKATLNAGIALLGANSDLNEERSLSYARDTVDIYSNSWGPSDSGSIVEGPGYLTSMSLQNGVKEVSYISICLKLVRNFQLIILRGVMEKDLYLYGLMVMEERRMTVLLMDMHQVCTQSLLVLLEWMDYPAHLMNHALQKWSSPMLQIQQDILLW